MPFTKAPQAIEITGSYRWKELTYKLIYPAFFGNMVYDFVMLFMEMLKASSVLNICEVTAVLIVLIFFALDYVHLNIDLEHIIDEDKKDWVYMACDIGVSFFFFLSVVFIKSKLDELALCVLPVVPLLFSVYHFRLNRDTKFYNPYGIVAVLVFIGSVIISVLLWGKDGHRHPVIVFSLLGSAFAFALAYFIYTLKHYWLQKKTSK